MAARRASSRSSVSSAASASSSLRSSRGFSSCSTKREARAALTMARSRKPSTISATDRTAPAVLLGGDPIKPTVVIKLIDHQMPRQNDVTVSVSSAVAAPAAQATETTPASTAGRAHERRGRSRRPARFVMEGLIMLGLYARCDDRWSRPPSPNVGVLSGGRRVNRDGVCPGSRSRDQLWVPACRPRRQQQRRANGVRLPARFGRTGRLV